MTSAPAIIPGFLDMELLSRLPSLDLQARYLVEGFLTGLHRSPVRGHNVEFKEFRAYQPGDEPRTVDWKVYARTDRLHVKVREEDTNLTAYVVVDNSASMSYRSAGAVMSKWEYARSVAAALLVLLHRQRDAASLALAGRGLDVFIPPSLKGSELHRMMGALHREADAPGGPLAGALDTVAQLARRRSLVFVISDFYEVPAALDGPVGRLHYNYCEPVFMHVMDPRELDFDFDAPVLLQELETRGQMSVSPDLLRGEYLKRLNAHRAALRDFVCRYGGDYVLLRTDQAPVHGLGAYLARRKGML